MDLEQPVVSISRHIFHEKSSDVLKFMTVLVLLIVHYFFRLSSLIAS